MKIYGPDIAEGSELGNLTVPTGTAFPVGTESEGEIFYRTDSNQLYIYSNAAWDKIGTDAYPPTLTAAQVGAISTTLKGANNGVAELDAGGKIPTAQIPSAALTDTFVVASEAAMIALSTAETGDVAVRSDVNKTFILKGTTYSTLGDWQELLSPSGSAVTSVDGNTGAITAAQIKTAYESNADSNAFDDAEQSKLLGIEAAATADQSAAEILASLKTVDVNGATGVNAGTFDGVVSTSFVRSDADDVISGDTRWTSGKSPYIEDVGTMGRVPAPGGAALNASGTVTGAWKIKFPTATSALSTMLSFDFHIFDYTFNESIVLHIAGYSYGANWTNESVQIHTSQAGKDFNVRFGTDGTSNCIWIGETSSTWSYPVVGVFNFLGGYSTTASAWASGWAISSVVAFDTVIYTSSGNLPIANADNADTVDGYHAAEASTISTVAVRNSSGDINARLFRSEYDSTNATIGYIMTQVDTVSNNYMRPSTPAQVSAALGGITTTAFVKGVTGYQLLSNQHLTCWGTTAVAAYTDVLVTLPYTYSVSKGFGLGVVTRDTPATQTSHMHLKGRTNGTANFYITNEGGIAQVVSWVTTGFR